MNSSRFRHTESSLYASATRAGSREFHASSAALTFALAAASSNGGSGGRRFVMPMPFALEVGMILRRPPAPAFAMCVLRGALYRRVAPAQQKTARRADVGSNEAEIGGRVEEAGIPAIPRGKDLLDPFTKRHLSSPIPSRFEPIRPDSAWQPHEVAVSRAARFPPRSPADPRARACSPAASRSARTADPYKPLSRVQKTSALAP